MAKKKEETQAEKSKQPAKRTARTTRKSTAKAKTEKAEEAESKTPKRTTRRTASKSKKTTAKTTSTTPKKTTTRRTSTKKRTAKTKEQPKANPSPKTPPTPKAQTKEKPAPKTPPSNQRKEQAKPQPQTQQNNQSKNTDQSQAQRQQSNQNRTQDRSKNWPQSHPPRPEPSRQQHNQQRQQPPSPKPEPKKEATPTIQEERPLIKLDQTVAVLVDGNNIEMSLHSVSGRKGAMINFDKLVPALVGSRSLARFIYFREGRSISGKLAERLQKLFYGSVVPCHKSADIPLSIKAVQIASKVDTIIILSGDADYVELVRHLKHDGIRVEIAAFPKTTADILRNEADFFFPITVDYSFMLK